jgi:hypothetical protein
MRASERRQAYRELLDVIRGVRRRWRTRLLLRGLAAAGALSLGALLLAGFVLARLQYAPEAVVVIRIALGAVTALAVVWFVVRPLFRRVSEQAVALYIEEHEPSLESALLSAIEARDDDDGGSARAAVVSDALLRRTLETAIGRCHQFGDGRYIEQRGLIRVAAALLAVVVVGAVVGFLGPATGRLGAAALLAGARDAEAAGAPAIGVEPGHATVSRGADVPVSARLHGFSASLAELAVRAAADSTFDRLPMAAGPDGDFAYILFDVDDDAE